MEPERRAAINRIVRMVYVAMVKEDISPTDRNEFATLEIAGLLILAWAIKVQMPIEPLLSDLCTNLRRNYQDALGVTGRAPGGDGDL